MKQHNLFGNEFAPESETKYSSKIKAPVYEITGLKPNILELYNNSKTLRLINEINSFDIPEEEKKFLIIAAQRHTIFNYEKIAEFYAHSTISTQQLMEHSALVIIDFEKAIQYGYVRLSDEIRSKYLESYEK